MSERLFRLPGDEGIYDFSRLDYGEGFQKTLLPCEVIRDEELCLGIIGNSCLRPDKLHLNERDKNPVVVSIQSTGEIKRLDLPGKSAEIIFDPDSCGKHTAREIVSTTMGGRPDRRDNLYTATVGQINSAGWVAFWAPIQLEYKTRHARIVANTTINYNIDPTESDLANLASVLTKRQ
ncbi:hypothetical protein A2803_03430 [Candidatus Woesebacteria bacterium RIFCSPHIGHO2_01_FULL_44_21]|uniref:Uncharacterized protein n=1 Tax=Candidatus Woesebacteria bacterium RIFCSPHIGHO2_01_FULL_44_21 TaxID=1802503 RepID=A0A1F7YYT9_9BACT|nr:MAG: hypothetical protein A2803_03430 [Candidatus Woesebacteria bacterium RIFCSPHIGHO2_01_FULL_44_21]OGM69118.1 MAG: hypothetical protein A2897_04810 [Candidatus Woesebacteria bacterium RIFCSPLOWO2_01_FULL_44_24b]